MLFYVKATMTATNTNHSLHYPEISVHRIYSSSIHGKLFFMFRGIKTQEWWGTHMRSPPQKPLSLRIMPLQIVYFLCLISSISNASMTTDIPCAGLGGPRAPFWWTYSGVPIGQQQISALYPHQLSCINVIQNTLISPNKTFIFQFIMPGALNRVVEPPFRFEVLRPLSPTSTPSSLLFPFHPHTSPRYMT